MSAQRATTVVVVLAAIGCMAPERTLVEGAGGTAGAGGSGGTGGEAQVDKIDLLFMIDNSSSMADKQKILAEAVPDLVQRLTNPMCIDPATGEQVGAVQPGAYCNAVYAGSEREFEPVIDIHIGVITSSLGGHGADACSKDSQVDWNPRQEDMSHLIARGKNEDGVILPTVETYEGLGFLNWDPSGKKSDPPGQGSVEQLTTSFTYMVRGAEQDGCGFEASLEAWRRFLVDPAPYERMIPGPCHDGDPGYECRVPSGLDQVVLKQRADFLREDSLLAVIMLTDENDCSVIDGGQNYFALQALGGGGLFHIRRGTDACLTDPWDEDCKSCWEVSTDEFPECVYDWQDPDVDDPLNLRCYEQKRRFGRDMLYPVRRYIDALTDSRLDDGTLNPIFCQSYTDETRTQCARPLRHPSLVLFGGIVGVPWQDIAVNPDDLKDGYRPIEQLSWTPAQFVESGVPAPVGVPEGKTLWNMILGEVDEDPGVDADNDGQLSFEEKNVRYGSIVPRIDPLDPLMKESVEPRTGIHPATGVALVPPGTNPEGHPVNGAERLILDGSDLQYACVFRLGQFGPLDCSGVENSYGCDCRESPTNPLCWDGTSYGSTQYRAKAYPGRRQLAVLKGLGSRAIVASVCPANVEDATASDFGYRPAIGAIVSRLRGRLE